MEFHSNGNVCFTHESEQSFVGTITYPYAELDGITLLGNGISFSFQFDSLVFTPHFRGLVNKDSMITDYAFPVGNVGEPCVYYSNLFVKK